MSEVFGIDVSHHQGVIDWKKVSDNGTRFAIMKCQYESGSHRIDEQFEANYKGCGDNGIARGVYIYIARDSMKDIEGDARALIFKLGGRPLEYGIWLDLEDRTVEEKGKAYIRDLAYKYAEIFKSAGYYVGIYCNKAWYDTLIHEDLKRDFDIWFARYPKNDTGLYDRTSSLKPSTSIAVAWQYSSKGHIPGINGNVDLDVDFDGIVDLNTVTNTNIVVGSARINEKGTVSGGQCGDQKQTSVDDFSGEVSMQNFYIHKKGWVILRHPDKEVREKIADAMVRACNNPNIGYSQAKRMMILTAGTDTKEPTDCDCSSLVRQCVIEATHKDPGNFTTGNEASTLEAHGFKRIEYTDKHALCRGDILVTMTKGHTVVVTNAEPKENPYREPITTITKGMSGNAVKWIQYELNRYGYGLAEDGIFGDLTEAAVKDFKQKYLYNMGAVDELTRNALKEGT